MLQTSKVLGCNSFCHIFKQQHVFAPWLHDEMGVKIHASVKGLVREIRYSDLSTVETMGFLEMIAVVVTPAHLLTGNQIQQIAAI